MTRLEFINWKREMENKIERKELTPLEEGNVRMFCVIQLKKPFDEEDTELERTEISPIGDRS